MPIMVFGQPMVYMFYWILEHITWLEILLLEQILGRYLYGS